MIWNLIVSWFKLTRYILFGKPVNLILYSPQHFNRSINKSNPYFDPIIEVCKKNKISYLVLEEPSKGTFPRNPQYIQVDLLFWLIGFLRKLVHIVYRNVEYIEIEKRVAKIINWITFQKFQSKRYITISNSMLDFWGELNPKGKVFDYQHGIIYNGHPGYFKCKDKILPSFEKKNRGVLVWGQLYKDMFNNSELNNRTEIVGYPIVRSKINREAKHRGYIVISLQITMDDKIWYEHSPKMLGECLEILSKYNYKVLLKHHPRFNNIVDLSDICKKYPFVEFTSKSLIELVPLTFLHLTWSSTTCFEFANYGVPTFFITDLIIHQGHSIFYNQYKYPIYENQDLYTVLDRLTDANIYEDESLKVKEWYDNAYSSFNELSLLKLLTV